MSASFLACAVLALAAPGSASADPRSEALDLLSGANVRIDGGLADVIVGAYRADGPAGVDSGRAVVVFGTRAPSDIDLRILGDRGFMIEGARFLDFAGFSVSGAGDVNGDGRSDLVVGAPPADSSGCEIPERRGSLYSPRKRCPARVT